MRFKSTLPIYLIAFILFKYYRFYTYLAFHCGHRIPLQMLIEETQPALKSSRLYNDTAASERRQTYVLQNNNIF